MTCPKDIVDELRTIRVENKITQEHVCAVAGYNRSQILRYEAGTHTPRLDMVCNWAEVLGYELVLRPKA